jgi:lycopene beta-cyclase
MDATDTWFMDWRRDNGTGPDASPSFLYAMPLGDGTTLLEETCLVGRPALDQRELRRRLETRLRNRGIEVTGTERVERVRFPVESFRIEGAFGARGALMHPGTGYSVAASLATADKVAAALADGKSVDRALWPASARAVDRLRRIGLDALLTLEPAQVTPFFEAFFDLSVRHQRAYLSGRNDLPGTAAAMRSLFLAVPPDVRRVLLRAPFTRQIESIRT